MTQSAAFGQLASWDDAVPSGGGDFLNMKDDGDYVLRFLTDIPYEYPVHWIDVGTSTQRRMVKVKCAGRGCMVCAKGEKFKAKNTFLANVMNRKDGQCYAFEFGRQIFDQLKGYAMNQKWGDIRGYDVRINKKKGRKPNVYMVQAEPPIGELTPAEVETAHEHCTKRTDLNKMAASSTNEEIQQKLAEFMNEGGGVSADTSFTQTPPTITGFDPMVSSGDAQAQATDFTFPDFN